MNRFYIKELKQNECTEQLSARIQEKRISYEISQDEGWVQVNACGPCAERLKKEEKPVEPCEKCVNMTLDIIHDLEYHLIEK